MAPRALHVTIKVEVGTVREKLIFSFPRSLRLGIAFIAIVGLAGVPLWSSSQLIKARDRSAQHAAALSERTSAWVELSRSERSGEMQQLKNNITNFERQIPFGAGQNHLRYVITTCIEESGAEVLTLKIGREESATLGGDDTFRKLPITLEAAGPPNAIGRIIDQLPALDRLIAIDQVHIKATLQGSGETTKTALHCNIEAHAFFRTIAFDVEAK